MELFFTKTLEIVKLKNKGNYVEVFLDKTGTQGINNQFRDFKNNY